MTTRKRIEATNSARATTKRRTRRPPSGSAPAEATHLLLFPDVETFLAIHRAGLAGGTMSVGLSTEVEAGASIVLRAGFVREREQHDLAGRVVEVDRRPGSDGFRTARIELNPEAAMAIRRRVGVVASIPPSPLPVPRATRRTRVPVAVPRSRAVVPGPATQQRMLSELDAFLAVLERKVREGDAPAPVEAPPVPARVVGRGRPIDESELAVSFQRLPRADQVRLAISGDRVARGFVLRKGKPDLHRMLLQNPRLDDEEVLSLASMPTTSGDVLERIGRHPEWSRSEAVRAALVSNPRSPVGLALRFVPLLSLGSLRRLARARDLRRPVDAMIRNLIANRRS